MTDQQANNVVLEWCRSCRDETEERGDYGMESGNQTPADVIVWGKLFPPEAMGPRCLTHYYAETNARRVDGYAVFDLRGLTR